MVKMLSFCFWRRVWCTLYDQEGRQPGPSRGIEAEVQGRAEKVFWALQEKKQVR